ncbi:unnamed protein product [Sphenostylis stenocarpa]|uniref:CCHC-type domain-containing protein n=1 Tax=Sphenostylis stenocarpa TaxID=92480 RepID=A0AA86SZD4_9FABA|nr:unnamed protein product [Sphenostylis stenocarpa]
MFVVVWDTMQNNALKHKIALSCGNSGHDMFGCRNDYSLNDLEEIQCYVCKRLGHLCCANSDDATPGEISCYKCGRLGHSGLACSRLRDDIANGAMPSSCYKCGGEGHFARECTSSVKVHFSILFDRLLLL